MQEALSDEPLGAQILSSRYSSILFVGTLSLVFIFKKHLEALKEVTYVLLAVICLFISLLLVMLLNTPEVDEKDWSDIVEVKLDFNILTAISIFIFTYQNQFIVFPAYAELEDKTNDRFSQAYLVMVSIYAVILYSVGIISVLMFGKDISPDLLDNIATRSGSVSLVVRVLYCCIIMFHLPFYFITIKEYMLVTYDEYYNRSISNEFDRQEENENQPTESTTTSTIL